MRYLWLHSRQVCLQNQALYYCPHWWNTSWHPVVCIRVHIFVPGTVSVLHTSEWEKEVAPAPLFSCLRGIFVFVWKHYGVQWQISLYKPHSHWQWPRCLFHLPFTVQVIRMLNEWNQAAGWAIEKYFTRTISTPAFLFLFFLVQAHIKKK